MNLILIRHAESEANAGYKTSDPATIGLTEKGKEEALTLSNRISGNPDLIIVTKYTRTQQTAAPFIGKFPETPVEIWPLHEFTFLSPLVCQNTTALDRQPLVKEYWDNCDSSFVHGPGAESFSQFALRVTDSMHKLRELPHSTIVIFTHGQVMKFVKQYLENGNQSPPTAIRYFRDVMLAFPIHNTDVLHFNF
ncbi:MAG: histidine phosphatase family protein [Bacteroidetes bacterium]|nr:histidine phosphatase family protein [Bacteroidota bacterium]